jgi:serine/threonine-protein kinase
MKVAYIGVEPEDGLYIRDLGSGEVARKIVPRAETPAFSPDSRSIAFASEGAIYRAGLAGDAPEKVVDGVMDIVGLHWAEDGYIYFAADYATGLSRVWAEGGEMESLTSPRLEQGEIGHVYPEMLPDGKTIVFNVYGVDGYELQMVNMESGEFTNLGPGVTPHFIKPDILIFAQGPRLLAARLDVDEARLGSPVVISEAIYHNITSFSTNTGVSQNGDIVFIDGASTWGVPLEIRKWDGSREIVAPEVSVFNQYTISRDGRYIAMSGNEAVTDPDIWLYDLQTKDTRRLTTDPLYDAAPSFSSDGSRIWFSSERDGISDIFSIDPATEEINVVFRDEAPKYVSDVSPDDQYLLFQRAGDLWKLDLVGDQGAHELVKNLVGERESDISPDGRWIAYSSDEFGAMDIFVIDDPLSRPRQRITIGGGQSPQWSLDGQYLFFKKGTELYRVAMNASGGRIGDPVRVMEGIYERFDLLPDGSGILVRATPPRRTARYIQDVVGLLEARLNAR